MDSMNLITLLHGTCNLIPSQAKILWDMPWQLEKCPKNGANKPDISILDKKNKAWSLVEGTICIPGTIAERTKYKQNKYVDLRLGIKNLYSGYKVKLITIVFDYLGVYNKDLDKELNMLFGPKVARVTIERSQKLVISQNCYYNNNHNNNNNSNNNSSVNRNKNNQ